MIEKYLDNNGKVFLLPKKHKKQIEVLEFFISKFEKEKIYSEKEVNAILDEWHSFEDPCRIRRALADASYFSRERDGSSYQRIK